MAWNREREIKSSASAARNAVRLHKSMTDAEKLLWNGLRYEMVLPDGAHFRRQFTIGEYVVDFVFLQFRLILEVDGTIHAAEHSILRDAARSKFLKNQGFTVLRFTNDDVALRRAAVLDSVSAALATTTPIRLQAWTPSPQGGRAELNP